MKDELKEKHFNPKAHILTLLGDELIKSPVMAIYELVKNSYDADSNKVDVYFRDIEDKDIATIVIEDDGIGMTSQIIEDVWLEPGSDFRKPIDKLTGLRQLIKSPINERIPMGEKGVGRFAVHKLGSQILLITRPLLIEFEKESRKIKSKVLANYEIQLYIDWKDFSQSKHLSDVPIKWKIKKNVEDFRFKDRSGTYIRLSGLKETWSRGMARDLKAQTLSMLSPRMKSEKFRINLNFDNKWLTDFPSVDKILDDAPFKITAYVDSEYNLDFDYIFKLKNNNKIGERIIKDDEKFNENIKGKVENSLRDILEKKEYDKEKIKIIIDEIKSKELPFGSLYIELYTFDLDSNSMRDYTNDSDLVKKVLKEHSGIKVFKNDLRIYDYGSPSNDWLGLDLERIQNKKWFSNNNVIGFIYLDAETSTKLIEKTNREGFVENDAYTYFHMVLKTILNDFAATRFSDRTKWLMINHKASNNLFDNKINNFKSIIESTDFTNQEKKDKLIEEAERLEDKYEEDKKILLIPAGVGMTASVALHEIEKLVPRMEETVKTKPLNDEIIKNQVEELKQYTEGIISVLRKGGDKPMDVKEAINRAFNNYKLKLSDRKISYEINIGENVNYINCEKRFFITMLMNIIDNSIYWLSTVNREQRGIYVNCFNEENSTILTVSDNGPGFKDDISDLIRPFFSRKNDGIGIGMYLIDTIMMKYGKLDIISIEELSELKIPIKYNGASLKLIFNKNKIS